MTPKRKSKAIFRGDDSDSDDGEWKKNEHNEKRESSGSNSNTEHRWMNHDFQGYEEPPVLHNEDFARGVSSSAAAYDLPYQDEPLASKQQYARPNPVTKPSTFASRKSLLDPSSFGFDAQNGDPRIIMREKGSDIDPRQHSSSKAIERGAGARDYDDDAHIELITVPGLGTEYSTQELKSMRGQTRRRRRSVGTRIGLGQAWFRRDEKLFCCFTPRLVVVSVFTILVLLAVTLYFVVPRVPLFAVQTMTPLEAVPDGSSMITHHSPTNFSMNMNVNLRVDNTNNWVGIKASKLTLDVTDLSTLKKVGKGTLDGQSFAARKKIAFNFPVHFAYASINVTGDQTWSHWINACGPKYDGTPRQSLNLQFTIRMAIRGLIGTKGMSVELADVECPFTLQPEQT